MTFTFDGMILKHIFAVWSLPIKTQCKLLGGVSKYRLKKILDGQPPIKLVQDETTRISLLRFLYKYMINSKLIHEEIPDPRFKGLSPLGFMLRFGIPGMGILEQYFKTVNKNMTLNDFLNHIGDCVYDKEAIHAYIYKYGGINLDTDIVFEGNVILLSKNALERLY